MKPCAPSVHHPGIFLWVLNNNGNVVALNLNVSDQLGYFNENLVGKSFFSFDIIPDFCIQNISGPVDNGGILYTSASQVRSSDGRIIPAYCIAERIFLPDDSYILLSALECEKQMLTDEFTLENAKSETLQQYRDNIFSVIAHDLRNPFNTILGYCELLNNSIVNRENSKSAIYTQIIRDATEQTLNYLVRLLDWGRLQNDHPPFNPVEFKADVPMKQVIRFCSFQADTKKISIILDLEPDLTIYGDQNMIRTVIVNLISNAIKYTRREGKIILKGRAVEKGVELSVMDNGTGIKKDDIGKLFNLEKPFTTCGTAEEQGSGLGLAICNSYVNMHKGSIKVESSYGKGSVFTCFFPTMNNE